MTIKELKDIIKDLPDNMIVGGSGHFGELLDCYDVYQTKVSKNHSFRKGTQDNIDILCIAIEEAGPCPD